MLSLAALSYFAYSGFILHSVVIPMKHGGSYRAEGDDATVAGIIYTVLCICGVGIGLGIWSGYWSESL